MLVGAAGVACAGFEPSRMPQTWSILPSEMSRYSPMGVSWANFSSLTSVSPEEVLGVSVMFTTV